MWQEHPVTGMTSLSLANSHLTLIQYNPYTTSCSSQCQYHSISDDTPSNEQCLNLNAHHAAQPITPTTPLRHSSTRGRQQDYPRGPKSSKAHSLLAGTTRRHCTVIVGHGRSKLWNQIGATRVNHQYNQGIPPLVLHIPLIHNLSSEHGLDTRVHLSRSLHY
jgi:hypothetical protein